VSASSERLAASLADRSRIERKLGQGGMATVYLVESDIYVMDWCGSERDSGSRLMTIERLSAALADRYRIERELGQGGMATAYLGQDLKHDRKVAIKVLGPEPAAVIGAERGVHVLSHLY